MITCLLTCTLTKWHTTQNHFSCAFLALSNCAAQAHASHTRTQTHAVKKEHHTPTLRQTTLVLLSPFETNTHCTHSTLSSPHTRTLCLHLLFVDVYLVRRVCLLSDCMRMNTGSTENTHCACNRKATRSSPTTPSGSAWKERGICGASSLFSHTILSRTHEKEQMKEKKQT